MITSIVDSLLPYFRCSIRMQSVPSPRSEPIYHRVKTAKSGLFLTDMTPLRENQGSFQLGAAVVQAILGGACKTTLTVLEFPSLEAEHHQTCSEITG